MATPEGVEFWGQASHGVLPSGVLHSSRASTLSRALGVPDRLSRLALPLPHRPGELAREDEESVLRQAGSVTQSMPPLAERASARTAVDGVLLLDGALSVRQAADLLGVTAGRMRQRLTARTLRGVHTRRGGSCRPSSPTGRELRGLDRVLAAVPDDVRPLRECYDLDPFTRSQSRDTPPGRTSQLLVA